MNLFAGVAQIIEDSAGRTRVTTSYSRIRTARHNRYNKSLKTQILALSKTSQRGRSHDSVIPTT